MGPCTTVNRVRRGTATPLPRPLRAATAGRSPHLHPRSSPRAAHDHLTGVTRWTSSSVSDRRVGRGTSGRGATRTGGAGVETKQGDVVHKGRAPPAAIVRRHPRQHASFHPRLLPWRRRTSSSPALVPRSRTESGRRPSTHARPSCAHLSSRERGSASSPPRPALTCPSRSGGRQRPCPEGRPLPCQTAGKGRGTGGTGEELVRGTALVTEPSPVARPPCPARCAPAAFGSVRRSLSAPLHHRVSARSSMCSLHCPALPAGRGCATAGAATAAAGQRVGRETGGTGVQQNSEMHFAGGHLSSPFPYPSTCSRYVLSALLWAPFLARLVHGTLLGPSGALDASQRYSQARRCKRLPLWAPPMPPGQPGVGWHSGGRCRRPPSPTLRGRRRVGETTPPAPSR